MLCPAVSAVAVPTVALTALEDVKKTVVPESVLAKVRAVVASVVRVLVTLVLLIVAVVIAPDSCEPGIEPVT
jgi:hypothetical protein